MNNVSIYDISAEIPESVEEICLLHCIVFDITHVINKLPKVPRSDNNNFTRPKKRGSIFLIITADFLPQVLGPLSFSPQICRA